MSLSFGCWFSGVVCKKRRALFCHSGQWPQGLLIVNDRLNSKSQWQALLFESVNNILTPNTISVARRKTDQWGDWLGSTALPFYRVVTLQITQRVVGHTGLSPENAESAFWVLLPCTENWCGRFLNAVTISLHLCISKYQNIFWKHVILFSK